MAVNQPYITILTPAYNRASLLPRLFDSLLRQTFKDFEWIVVDDGSTDNTREVLASIKERCGDAFPMTCLYKENGGKHTAVNLGVQLAKGDLTLILDSDDELPPTAIGDILAKIDAVKNEDKVDGLCFYMAHRNGQVIGRPVLDNILTDSLHLRYKLKVSGDMCEILKTSVLRENPFPVVSNERFCPEALLLNRIALKHKMLLCHDVVYLRDYLDGGLTDNIVRIRMKSPSASMMTYAELTESPVPFMVRIKAAINFWRFWYCRTTTSVVPHIAPLWHCLRPVGRVMHRRDERKNNKQ